MNSLKLILVSLLQFLAVIILFANCQKSDFEDELVENFQKVRRVETKTLISTKGGEYEKAKEDSLSIRVQEADHVPPKALYDYFPDDVKSKMVDIFEKDENGKFVLKKGAENKMAAFSIPFEIHQKTNSYGFSGWENIEKIVDKVWNTETKKIEVNELTDKDNEIYKSKPLSKKEIQELENLLAEKEKRILETREETKLKKLKKKKELATKKWAMNQIILAKQGKMADIVKIYFKEYEKLFGDSFERVKPGLKDVLKTHVENHLIKEEDKDKFTRLDNTLGLIENEHIDKEKLQSQVTELYEKTFEKEADRKKIVDEIVKNYNQEYSGKGGKYSVVKDFSLKVRIQEADHVPPKALYDHFPDKVKETMKDIFEKDKTGKFVLKPGAENKMPALSIPFQVHKRTNSFVFQWQHLLDQNGNINQEKMDKIRDTLENLLHKIDKDEIDLDKKNSATIDELKSKLGNLGNDIKDSIFSDSDKEKFKKIQRQIWGLEMLKLAKEGNIQNIISNCIEEHERLFKDENYNFKEMKNSVDKIVDVADKINLIESDESPKLKEKLSTIFQPEHIDENNNKIKLICN